ncbi:TIGR00300 family protein [Glycomyces buryatensis]|uniref:ornithine cyclodeaminase n=1 Tax=Glycomyces buryatensis TaxID=2570927 RepID=A0A4S8QE74_9ACTN|nr:TIGR00300 family protein [Glycomyces buryatensis]THV39489.1 TIGR00300 family protein [Glycomyces buryatensis]
MDHAKTVELRGHLIDQGVFARVMDDVLEYSGAYSIDRFDVGRHHTDESYVQLTVTAETAEQVERIVMRLQTHGANPLDPGIATLKPAPADGVFPEDFYSTTNFDTQVRLNGGWMDVRSSEMDCGIIVSTDHGSAWTLPVSDVKEGELVVCGGEGVKVLPLPEPERSDPASAGFEFMNSGVSSERPQALQVRQIAQQMRDVKARGEKILWVGGPAIVHTGAGKALEALIDAGYVDLIFAGNALAAHDIESNLYGTSLGVDLDKGHGVPHGHEHHIRAINRIRACGSIAAAVDQGVLTGGIMHAMVKNGKQYVLVGSVRDDGPLPDVHTDVIDGQRAMRDALPGTGFAIMVATMLHSIATGNLLPASVPLVSVDINPATVTKLADRGSAQAIGVITDIGLFCEQLAGELVKGYRRE